MDLKRLAVAVAISAFPATGAIAQDNGNAQQPAPAPWGTTCTSEGRDTAIECLMEQRVVMSDTGVLLASVTLQPVNGSDAPMMIIRVPYGLYLPAGLRMAVDSVAIDTLPFQTCDNQGCFAGGPTSATVIDKLKAGNNLELTFQDQLQRDISVPVSLLGFTAALARIQ